MTGFFADGDLSLNRIELARQAAESQGYIDLTSSNPTHQGFTFPDAVLRAAAERYLLSRTYEPDPRGLLAARQAIADYYMRRTPSYTLSTENIFLTASTSEAYGLLFALLTNPGDNVLAPVVSYPLFEYLANIYRVDLRPYALDEAHDWRIDPASLRVQVDDRTRAVLIVSPHNPTGAVVREALPTLERLGLPLICDEVFAEFSYRAPATPPLSALFPGLPVFLLNGISKMFALPDLKLGWIGLNEPASAAFGDRLELLNDTFLSSNSLTQAMLPDMFSQGWPFVTQMVAQVRSNLDRAIEILSANPRIHVHQPDGGYYLFPSVEGWDDEEELVIHLLNHGVLVHPGYFYGYEQGTHIMLSCLTERSQLEIGVQRLVEAL
ncbi:pyridoxal phosphate-dependent aminotransferase [Chloroflexia bacterium SDU3-3]|nr:pyridoxal phosphate-dependent aminotransferase [Chloroflexia bacterium SDU3-3]